MSVTLSPLGGVAAQFFDSNGVILSGGKIYTYAAGTTTKQATFTSSTGSTALPNPIVLDSAGRVPTGEIWLTANSQYKFEIKNANESVTIGTYDNITGINSSIANFVTEQEFQTATAGQTVFNLTTMQYQPGTNSLSVFVDGVNQYGPGAQYSYVETDSDTVTFNTGLHVGAQVKFTTSNINSTAGGSAFAVSYLPPFTGSVVTNVGDKLAEIVSVTDFGATGDGTTDDTAAIQAALNTTATGIYFPEGTYRINNPTNSSTPVLTSSISDRILYGPGVITATSQVKVALRITGANTTVSLHIDGNNFIGYAIEVAAQNPTITGCYIHDLNGFTDWGGIAVRLDFDGLDTTALVSNNVIKNLQGVGDGSPGGGVGQQRAVLVQTDQDCTKQIFITGNHIDIVEGEEGDAIVIQGGTTANTKKVPAIISNNVVKAWNRRAIKIAANGVTVANNYLTNPLGAPVASLQRVIDATSASNFVVTGNILKECKYQLQIAVVLSASQSGNEIIISNNIIEGTGTTDSSGLIVLKTFGADVTIQNNTINWPDHTTRAIEVTDTDRVYVFSNIIDVGTTSWYLFTSSTNVRLNNNTNKDGGNLQSYFDGGTGDLFVNLTAGSQNLVLYNSTQNLVSTDPISKISCRQNDTGTPTTTASIRFISEGTAGQTAIALFTGTTAAPDTEKVRVTNSGIFRPATDNTQALGFTSFRWSDVYAGNPTIITSDGNEKQQIRTLLESEKAVAVKLKSLIRAFKFNNAVETKKENARIHIGVIAQDVKTAFESEGLDAHHYGMFCADTLDDGSVRLGVRYDELLAFVISAI